MDVDRRTFVTAAAAGPLVARAAPAIGAGDAIPPTLSAFATRYLAARNAPGMILGMAARDGLSRTAAFGYADVEARRTIRADERFHIGSITKSFTALMILQLVDEGKVRLDADITTYLPGLPLRTPFGAVTVHHLLCHTSGAPSEAPAAGWPDQTVEQVFAPGSRFHYCNMGYGWLGEIVAVRGGESWSDALHRRVLDPLGMTNTSPLIGAGMRRLEVPSYVRRDDGRPFSRMDALTRAGPQTFTLASGCIASTAADMNRYIAMIASGGRGPKGRLLSPELFALMTKRQISAAEFGPEAGYGYGWMIEGANGRRVIRHTGGMESFMSSIHVDLDAGVGAFASINAQQNYRPVPVTAYAVELLRARNAGSPAPKPPVVDPDDALTRSDYAGAFAREDGEIATVSANGRTLRLALGGRTFDLESLDDDKFACRDPQRGLFTILFRREVPLSQASPGGPNRVVTLDWGRDSYIRRGAQSPSIPKVGKRGASSERLGDYEGLYVADGGWLRSVRAVVRDGTLWIDSFDGVAPLANVGDDRFRFADEPANPEVAAFSAPSVSPRTLSLGGSVLVRLGPPTMEIG